MVSNLVKKKFFFYYILIEDIEKYSPKYKKKKKIKIKIKINNHSFPEHHFLIGY